MGKTKAKGERKMAAESFHESAVFQGRELGRVALGKSVAVGPADTWAGSFLVLGDSVHRGQQ